MPIENIPAIREDYPLFSWDDHKESFAALKQRGEVAGFKKETWNAIIETLEAVLSESGLQWDKSSYTTAENAKITQAYGELRAAMFNAVRHNIDRPAPIGWRWANDKSFRGYVGRKDFRGYSEYGAQCDLFYAEYLVEIVRKLNLLIEILRGTAPFADFEVKYNIQMLYESNLLARHSAPFFVSYKIKTPYESNLLARPSALIIVSEIGKSNINDGFIARESAPIVFIESVGSKTEADIAAIKSKPIDFSEQLKTECTANATAIRSALMNTEDRSVKTDSSADLLNPKSAVIPKYEKKITSNHDVFLYALKVVELDGEDISTSAIHAEVHSFPSSPIVSEMQSVSFDSAELRQGIALPIGAESLSESGQSAELRKCISFPISAEERAKSSESAKINAIPSKRIIANKTAKTTQAANMEQIETKRMETSAEQSASIADVSLDFAWIPPIRTGNNLHIRQVYDMERNVNDLRLI